MYLDILTQEQQRQFAQALRYCEDLLDKRSRFGLSQNEQIQYIQFLETKRKYLKILREHNDVWCK